MLDCLKNEPAGRLVPAGLSMRLTLPQLPIGAGGTAFPAFEEGAEMVFRRDTHAFRDLGDGEVVPFEQFLGPADTVLDQILEGRVTGVFLELPG